MAAPENLALCFDFPSAERDATVHMGKCKYWLASLRAREAMCHALFETGHLAAQDQRKSIDDATADELRRDAVIHLGHIAVRAAASAQCLISSGYAPEAKAPVRRLTEATHRGRAIAEDETGSHARAWLKGRPIGTPGQLRARYSKSGVDAFSDTAHAGIDGLDLLFTRFDGKPAIALLPTVDPEHTNALLGILASQLMMMYAVICNTISPLLSISTITEMLVVEQELGSSALLESMERCQRKRVEAAGPDIGANP
jgi:hypothetical protein